MATASEELREELRKIVTRNGKTVKIPELLEAELDNLLALFEAQRTRIELEAEIKLLNDTAKGFESVLMPEFEMGGLEAIKALRQMAIHKQRELTALDRKEGKDE